MADLPIARLRLYTALGNQRGQAHREKVGNHIKMPYNQMCTLRNPHQYECRLLLNVTEKVHRQKRDTS